MRILLNTQKGDCYAPDIIRRNGFVRINPDEADCKAVYEKEGRKYIFDGWEAQQRSLNPYIAVMKPRYISMKHIS